MMIQVVKSYNLPDATRVTTVESTILLIHRANMPDKASEEKANLAKKLAEQRAKGVEGIPTTAKVRHPRPCK